MLNAHSSEARRRPINRALRSATSAPMIVALVALGVALGPTAWSAASKVAALKPNSVQSKHIKNGTIVAADLHAGGVTTAKLANKSVTSGKIAAGAVGSAQLAGGAVGTAQLAVGSVSSAQISGDAVTSSSVSADTLVAADLAAGSVGTSELVDGGIGASDLAADSVTSPAIAAGAVGTTELATSAVTAAKLGADSVTAPALDTNSVTADAIATGAVTADEIGVQAIIGSSIKDSTIGSEKFDTAHGVRTRFTNVAIANNAATNVPMTMPAENFDTANALANDGDDFLTLTPEGQWEVCITATWSANASGVRSIRFFDIEAQDFGATSPAMPTGTTLQSTCGIVRANLGGATINLEAYQSSGSGLFVSGYATAVRIADL